MKIDFDLNELPQNSKLIILDFLQNPSKKRALELLHQTPLILFAADEYFTKSEMEGKLKEIIASDVERKFISDLLEFDTKSYFKLELTSLKFILRYGSKSNCNIAKKINMENKLSHNRKK